MLGLKFPEKKLLNAKLKAQEVKEAILALCRREGIKNSARNTLWRKRKKL
jgi:hypothetical protein